VIYIHIFTVCFPNFWVLTPPKSPPPVDQDPAAIKWGESGAEYVCESTGAHVGEELPKIIGIFIYIYIYSYSYIYGGFHKGGVPQNGWFIMENPSING
jgi:hypothetical protein